MNESSSALAAYNSLADPVMSGYFGSERIRKYLVKQGLITKDGLIISESAYRDRFARESRTKHTSDKLARSIVHQALDEERAHQMAIRDKLDEISRLEHVRRLRAERELRKAVQSEHMRSETEWAVQSSKRPATGSGLQQRKKQQPNRLRPKSAPRRKFVTELELAEKNRHGNEVVIEEADSSSKDGQSPASKPEPADRSAVTTPRRSSHSSLRSTSLDDHFKRPRTPPEEHNRRGSTSRSRSPSPSRSRSPPSHSSRSKSPSPQRSRSRSRSHSRSPSPALARPRSRSVSQPVSRSADGRKSKRSAPQTAQDAKAKESRRPRTAKTASSSRVVVEKEAYLEYKRTLRQLLGGPRCIGFIPKPPNQKREGNTRVALRRHARRPDSAKRQQSGNEKPRGRSQDRRRASLPNGSSSPRATSRLPRSLERLKSFCKLTFRFNGLRKKQSESGEKRENASANEKHMISVEQQHCGGNTLEVFRGQLCPNSELEFMSQRHRGYPLGLTIYVDGACDFRISQCCESKRKVGTQFGQFTLVSVANAQPCYRCRLDRQEAEKRKKKLNGDKDGEEADKAQSEEGDKHQNANEGDKAKRSRSHENSYSSDAFEDEDDGSKKDHDSAAALQAIRSAPLPIVQSPSAKQPEDSQLTPKKNVQVEQDSDADNEPEAEADSQTKAFENETEAQENARDEQAESPAPSDGQSALAGKNLPSRGSGSLSSQGSLSTPKDSAAVKATTSNADNEQLSDDEEDVSDGGAEDEGNREMKDARTAQNVTLKNNDSISSSNLQSLLTAFQANTSLESLVFASLSALNDDILAEILQSVSRQSILRTIGISDCVKLTSKCGQVLAKSLSKFANLETIGISGVSLGDAGVKELTGAIVKQFSGDDDQSANIYGSFGLRSLSLSNCDIGDDGVLSVVELIRCDSPIDTLHLVGCSASVSVETWSQFGQAVAENTELASLNLSNCMLTGEKLRTICENLQMNRSVQRLDIRSNLCTADCGKYLLELAKNSSTLKFIECDFGNDFDDETLEEIERILRRKAAGRLDN